MGPPALGLRVGALMLALVGQVSAALAARAIPHAMIGAGAMAVHGVSRSTVDVDLFRTPGTSSS